MFPVNVQSFDPENTVIKNISAKWNYWLADETIETFQKAGCYDQYFSTGSKVFNNTRVLAVTT